MPNIIPTFVQNFKSMSIQLGVENTLTITRFTDNGAYLCPDDSDEEVLLPHKYIDETMTIGTQVAVFVYNDSEDRPVATTEQPKASVGHFAFLQVVSVSSVGAFLDWGLAKDLLVPFREQKVRMAEGRFYTVYVYIDDNTQRIVASAKIDKFLDNTPPRYKQFQQVDCRVVQRTDLGFKVIIDDLHWGMLYHNQIFTDVNVGDRFPAHIKCVRPDGKIDVIMCDRQKDRVAEIADTILDYLKQNHNVMHITDASTPDEIRVVFKCSKKDFKKALGQLFKSKQIDLSDKTKVTLIG